MVFKRLTVFCHDDALWWPLYMWQLHKPDHFCVHIRAFPLEAELVLAVHLSAIN